MCFRTRYAIAPLLILRFFQGDLAGLEGVPVRVHDQCLTSEVLGSLRCDCKQQLELAMDYVSEHGGCVIYMQQVGFCHAWRTESGSAGPPSFISPRLFVGHGGGTWVVLCDCLRSSATSL